MKKPDVPPAERTRLDTLQSLNILDTPPEERFDRLTRMARRLFGVPIALVSLVDEHRLWLKSCFGLDVHETPRETSFCGHAILGDELFVIPDTLADKRFADNPWVTNDPHIRFYAGCPLRAPNGQKMGTLCIIDTKPRTLAKEDLDALVDLTAVVEREFSAIQMATMDELTDISNRRGFMLLAQHSMHLCIREKLPAALVFIDLDNFKHINDTYGHMEGDRTLSDFATQLKTSFRESDIVARLGGDEFAILLTNHTRDEAEHSVERFRQSLDKLTHDSQYGYDINFSYGIVEYDPDRHTSVEALLEAGDRQMYQNKKSLR